MKYSNIFLLALLTAGLMFGCEKAETPVFVQEDPVVEALHGEVIVGQYIIVYREDPGLKNSLEGFTYDERIEVVRAESEVIFTEAGIPEDAIFQVYGSTIRGVAARLSESDALALERHERISYIEPDRVIIMRPPWEREPSPEPDPDPDPEDPPEESTQVVPWGIARVGGFVTYTGDKKAWVIDTGVEFDHPDLNVNTSLSKTFITRGPDAQSANDLNGHGTHVAGTIAAIDNNFGVVGVAAGAKVVAVKVLDRRGSGSYSGVIAGVDYVGSTASAGDVANMSLGGPASNALDDAVHAASNKGIWFVIAAGNDGKDANNYSPARVTGTYVYTISAMDSNDNWASFSNWGNPPIDYCAPGVSVNSTWINGGYRTISGTSMAAPHAAGVRLLGNPKTDGFVKNDPDGNPDPIIHR